MDTFLEIRLLFLSSADSDDNFAILSGSVVSGQTRVTEPHRSPVSLGYRNKEAPVTYIKSNEWWTWDMEGEGQDTSYTFYLSVGVMLLILKEKERGIECCRLDSL